jgi:tetratricopeptide (TPR) repeat protein
MKKILLYSFIGLALLGSSCSESFLDQEPPLELSEARIYTDATRIEGTCLGLYTTLKSGLFMGEKSYIVFDNRGNDIININNDLVTLADTYYMNVGTTYAENSDFWYYAYLTINRANVFMEKMNQYGAQKLLGDAVYNQYMAEAKFIRGLCYYYLCQLYAKPYVVDANAIAVPLRLEAITTNGKSKCPSSTISTIYNTILKDLDAATINALPHEVNTYDAATRTSQAAAQMLKMRVYMAMQNWDEAIKCGEAVKGYSLTANVAASFSTPYFSTETIFALPMSTNSYPNTQQSFYEFYADGTICVIDKENGVMGKAPYCISDDARIKNFTTIDKKGNTVLAKYQNSKRLDWVHIFRYAETKLDLAECYYHKSRISDAQTALNDSACPVQTRCSCALC